MVKSLPIRITKPLVPHTNRNTQTSKLYSHRRKGTAHCRQAAIAQTSAHGAFGFPTGNCQNLRRRNCQRQGKRYFALALVGSSVVSRSRWFTFFPVCVVRVFRFGWKKVDVFTVRTFRWCPSWNLVPCVKCAFVVCESAARTPSGPCAA